MISKLVYIAGPYTKGDVAENINNVIKIADLISDLGCVPFIPHLTHFWHLISPKPYDFWIQYDDNFLPLCNILFRISGESVGADKEVENAIRLNMPVVYSIKELKTILSP